MQRFSIFIVLIASILSATAGSADGYRASGRKDFPTTPKLTCPTGEGCTIDIPSPPQSGPKPEAPDRLVAKFIPDETPPPKGNPEGAGTR